MYHMFPMQIYLSILLCLTIALHHTPIMKDVRHQQEVDLSMNHLRNHLKVILISTMPRSRKCLMPTLRLLLNFQRQREQN
ncbi:hypothetical protein J008_04737 [Cryptococcus neoformans]|nr:hypothetical protein J008_04738 [Cryptococcus neoformans var. grubii]OXH27433.1 hypothetical protein J008_04737 [Cryptococcus neoformans var. grubii]